MDLFRAGLIIIATPLFIYFVKMAGLFHSNHAKNIRLLDNGTVASRIDGTEGVVFSKVPIPIGTVFELKIVEQSKSVKDVGSLVSLYYHVITLLFIILGTWSHH